MKKTVIQHLILTGILSLTLTVSTSYALGPLAFGVWEAVRDLAIVTAGSLLPELLKEDPKPEDIAALKQKVAELEKKLAEAEKNRQAIPAEELKQVKDLLANFSSAVNQLSVTGNKLADTEKTVANLRNQLTALSKPVDLELNYVYRASSQKEFSPLRNGSVLHSRDMFKILLKPAEDCYVYLFSIDAAGKLLRLFPMESFGGVTVNNFNPVKAGQTYYIPAKTQSFELDKQKGTETLYLLVSRQPDAVLEQVDKLQIPATRFASLMRQTKGIAGIKEDAPGSEVQWQEVEQPYSTFLRHLEGACNGCVQTLKFEHQSNQVGRVTCSCCPHLI